MTRIQIYTHCLFENVLGLKIFISSFQGFNKKIVFSEFEVDEDLKN